MTDSTEQKPLLEQEIPFPWDFQWTVQRAIEKLLAVDQGLLTALVVRSFFGDGERSFDEIRSIATKSFADALAAELGPDGLCHSSVRQFINETAALLAPQVLDERFADGAGRLRPLPRYRMRLVLEEAPTAHA
jgi:hypothetical protein